MRLCSPCREAITQALREDPNVSGSIPWTRAACSESECQFPTHTKLNEIKEDLRIEGYAFHDNERGIFARIRGELG
jgi:hypothetical protein